MPTGVVRIEGKALLRGNVCSASATASGVSVSVTAVSFPTDKSIYCVCSSMVYSRIFWTLMSCWIQRI